MHSLLPLQPERLLSRRDFLNWCAITSACAIGLACPSLPVFGKKPSTLPLVSAGDAWLIPLGTPRMNFPKESSYISGMPGSLMKVLTTVILLENQLVNPNQSFDCRGITNRYFTNGQTFHCSHPHGSVTLNEALAVSCNAYFAHAIQSVTVQQFLSVWHAFFPGKPITQNLSRNILPLCLLGYHPIVSLSASDILIWMQQLATNRNLMGKVLMGAHTFQMLRQGMRLAARAGTGKKADIPDLYHLVLKTGTTRHGNIYQSWVAGYFPFEKPQFVFCARAVNGTSEEKAIPLLQGLLSQYQKYHRQ